MGEKESYDRWEMTFKNMRKDFQKQGGDGKVGLGWGWWVLLMGEWVTFFFFFQFNPRVHVICHMSCNRLLKINQIILI